MAKVFEDIKLEWKGQEYIIESNKVMGAIARIEEVVTLYELFTMVSEKGSPRISAIARAYGTLLRYAGAKDEDDDSVYAALLIGKDPKNRTIEAVRTLLMMMVPPERKQANGSGEIMKELEPGEQKGQSLTVATRLSKKRTRRREAGG